MKERVGFMGLGIMGVPMAANIVAAGYSLTVYNRTPGKEESLRKKGARVASTPRALAQAADVIIAMVTGPEALNELLWGEDGAAAAFTGEKTFVNMSSVSPMFSRELARRLAPTGVAFVDAPVSGSKKPAENAALLILAGGPRDRVDALAPLFQTMGKRVVYCGEAGQGSMMKMMNNLLLGAMLEAFTESVQFGRTGGLSLESMLEVILSGPLSAPIFQMKVPMVKEGSYPPNFPLKHMTKDLKFVVDTAYETGAPVPIGHLLLHLFRLGVGQGLGDEDVAAIARVLENMAPGSGEVASSPSQ
ncbi:MAG: NAD(P)-dependent oxidoreductase [Deltaproteobacteria bacterium]|nr:NAD(P)-dependent oxidoreductase [Deltaproteobacteria bacterium]